MKLTVESRIHSLQNNYIELVMIMNDGQEVHQIRELVPDELMKDKRILKRVYDKMFYEMKEMLDNYYAVRKVI